MHSQQRKYVRDGHKNSRWFRYAFAECGDHLTINGNPLIHDPEKIHVGSYFTINNGAQICPRGGVYIGNYVTMSRGSQITAGMLDTSKWVEKRLAGTLDHVEREVYLADGTWLCVNSCDYWVQWSIFTEHDFFSKESRMLCSFLHSNL